MGMTCLRKNRETRGESRVSQGQLFGCIKLLLMGRVLAFAWSEMEGLEQKSDQIRPTFLKVSSGSGLQGNEM